MSQQRMNFSALAIVSMVLPILLLIVGVGLAFSGMSLSPDVARNFVSVFAFTFLGFAATMLVFNRVHAGGQRLALVVVSLVLLVLMFLVGVGLALSGLIPGMITLPFGRLLAVVLPFGGLLALVIILNIGFNLKR